MPFRPQSPQAAAGSRPRATPATPAALTTPTDPTAPPSALPPAAPFAPIRAGAAPSAPQISAPATGHGRSIGLTPHSPHSVPLPPASANAPTHGVQNLTDAPPCQDVPSLPAAPLPHPAILSGSHTAALGLERRQVAVLNGQPGHILACQAGEVWITEDGDQRDRILAAGQAIALTRRGPLVVSACRAARFVLAAPPGNAQQPIPRAATLGRTVGVTMESGTRGAAQLAAQLTMRLAALGQRLHLGHGGPGGGR